MTCAATSEKKKATMHVRKLRQQMQLVTDALKKTSMVSIAPNSELLDIANDLEASVLNKLVEFQRVNIRLHEPDSIAEPLKLHRNNFKRFLETVHRQSANVSNVLAVAKIFFEEPLSNNALNERHITALKKYYQIRRTINEEQMNVARDFGDAYTGAVMINTQGDLQVFGVDPSDVHNELYVSPYRDQWLYMVFASIGLRNHPEYIVEDDEEGDVRTAQQIRDTIEGFLGYLEKIEKDTRSTIQEITQISVGVIRSSTQFDQTLGNLQNAAQKGLLEREECLVNAMELAQQDAGMTPGPK